MTVDPAKITNYSTIRSNPNLQMDGPIQYYQGRKYQEYKGKEAIGGIMRLFEGITAFSLTLITLCFGLRSSTVRNLWSDALYGEKTINVFVEVRNENPISKKIHQVAQSQNTISEFKNQSFSSSFAKPDIQNQIQSDKKNIQTNAISANHPIKTANSKGKFVGELGAKWDFDSDHIPIAGGIELGNPGNQSPSAKIAFASFNVLNKNFLGYVYKPSNGGSNLGGTQGLDGSAITTNNVQNATGLTVREQNLINSINEMISPTGSGIVKRDILALQECSVEFENALRKSLPSVFKIISSNPKGTDRQLYIYNSSKLKCVKEDVSYSFQVNAGQNKNKKIKRMIFETVQTPKEQFCLVGVHLPGGPNSREACQELGKFLKDNHPKTMPVILLGDMNTETHNVGKGIKDAFDKANLQNPFQYLTDGTPTHINTQKQSVDYDSIHYAPGNITKNIWENQPNKILPGLKKLSDLLTV